MNYIGKIFLAATLSLISASPLPVESQTVIPGQCGMDECFEMQIEKRRPLFTNSIGTLNEVRVSTRSWKYSLSSNHSPKQPMRHEARQSADGILFGRPKISYVLCSTSKPAIIDEGGEQYGSNYAASLVNPNGIAPASVFRSAHQLYWAVCHNLVGPNYFTDEMVSTSIRLGYPGNLPENQIGISYPLDLMR